MSSSSELDSFYMQIASSAAKLSKANRAKVGACLVTNTGVVLPGVNGQPSGWENLCEKDNVTLPTTIHAETNAILKAAKEGVSVLDSTMYVTLSPCQSCAAMLAQSGVKRIVYRDVYRDTEGVDILKQHAIIIEQYQGD